MKKRTYKSASGPPGASSPSGMSAKTVATAKRVSPQVAQSQFGYIVRKARNRTPEQALEALIGAGIVTPEKELADHYKASPKASAEPSVKARTKPPASPKAAAKPKSAVSRASRGDANGA